MSLIIKPAKALVTAVALVFVWYGAMAGLFRLSEQAPGALVLFPGRHLSPQELPPGISVLKWNDIFAILASDDAGYVGALYAAGFPLVFPARSSGCLSYRGR
ncbi:hypothetical protein [Rhizobium herbae]|uniref:Uncharacterized protein n=1 Tax=Rhizobium herbae TaxID=508661 RepID=A0ABS4EFY1_9HYPH|nr:hypothetical protein [Rhizobium herbae]MBP1856824.1 hypothetical protein [Rhizobium herbae]